MPLIPPEYVPAIAKLLSSLAVVVVALVLSHAVHRVLRLRMRESPNLRTVYMLGRNAIFFLAAAIVLMIWLGQGSSFSVAMGILGAGIAFASQETIGSFAGYLYVVLGSIYRIGDRVQIGDVTGDVLDIGMMRTTLMEIGEWVKAEQYTGRVVSIANRAVFTDPVLNYTQYWSYLWDEITLPITYASDWRRAEEIMLAHGSEYTLAFQATAEKQLRKMMERYPVHATSVEPSLYLVMTDNWIELTLRYVVDARERRSVKAQLHYELLTHFEQEPSITVASATVEIVGFPPLKSA
jgi:hypothetical protein